MPRRKTLTGRIERAIMRADKRKKRAQAQAQSYYYNVNSINVFSDEFRPWTMPALINICRLCSKSKTDKQLVTIEDTNHEICHMLFKCCQVEIRIDDMLPKCVCLSCIEALQQAFAFYTMVHSSQESLSVFYSNSIVKEEVLENVASVETAITPELKEQTLRLTPNNKDAIIAYKSGDQILPTVIKVEKDDNIEQFEFISNGEEYEDKTLILEKTIEVDIKDKELHNKKILKGRNHETQESQTLFYPFSVAKVEEIPKNIAAVEKSIPAVLKDQKLQLAPNEYKEIRTAITNYQQNDDSYSLLVAKIGETITEGSVKRENPKSEELFLEEKEAESA